MLQGGISITLWGFGVGSSCWVSRDPLPTTLYPAMLFGVWIGPLVGSTSLSGSKELPCKPALRNQSHKGLGCIFKSFPPNPPPNPAWLVLWGQACVSLVSVCLFPGLCLDLFLSVSVSGSLKILLVPEKCSWEHAPLRGWNLTQQESIGSRGWDLGSLRRCRAGVGVPENKDSSPQKSSVFQMPLYWVSSIFSSCPLVSHRTPHLPFFSLPVLADPFFSLLLCLSNPSLLFLALCPCCLFHLVSTLCILPPRFSSFLSPSCLPLSGFRFYFFPILG